MEKENFALQQRNCGAEKSARREREEAEATATEENT